MAATSYNTDMRQYRALVADLRRAMNGAPNSDERSRLAEEVDRLENRIRDAEQNSTTCSL